MADDLALHLHDGDLRSLVGLVQEPPSPVLDAAVHVEDLVEDRLDGGLVARLVDPELNATGIQSGQVRPQSVVDHGEASYARVVVRQPAGVPALVPNPAPAGWRARLPGSAPILVELGNEEPQVALTFDDGPDPVGTPAVLDALDALDSVATFFVLADRVAADPGLARELVARGHGVGLHADRHDRLDRSSMTEVRDRLSGARAQVEDVVGRPVTLHRPPFGRLSWRMLQVCGSMGLRVVMWSHDPGDWRGIDEPALSCLLRQCLVPGAIVLLHDGNTGATTTASALTASGRQLHDGVRSIRLDDHP